MTDWSTWVTRGTAQAGASSAAGTRVRYALDGSTNGLLRPVQPTDGQPVPVVASPDLAALAGRDHVLGMTVEGVDALAVRVVAVARRFPTAGGSFVIADAGRAGDGAELERPRRGDADRALAGSAPERARAGGGGAAGAGRSRRSR